MATIEETPDVKTQIVTEPVAPGSDVQEPVAPVNATEAMVAAVEALNTEYNKSTEVLSAAEEAVQDAQITVFKLFLDVSKKTAGSELNAATLNTTAYCDVFHDFLSLKEDVFTKQSISFKLLQKLRVSHTNYLMAVITTLQKEATDLKSKN